MMNNQQLGQPITLEQMLDAREFRMHMQESLIEKFEKPLISFTLNIVGPVKVFDLSKKAYAEGIFIIKNYCKASGLNIVNFTEILENTGYEAFFSIDADPIKIKKTISQIETNCKLGRLFDIDVINIDGQKISRTDIGMSGRKCLLCENDTFVCSRSRAHSVDDILSATVDIMEEYFKQKYADKIAEIATRALLYEVQTTPKPGLVDKNNTGSHSDMNIFTFEKSAIALTPYFKEFVLEGTRNSCLQELFLKIRQIGISAEISMLNATNGVNTHKGIIFSLGIVCAALGFMQKESYSDKLLSETCATMTKELEQDFCNITKENAKSHGEKVFANYNIRGIRGEAATGFSSVFEMSLPFLKQCIGQNQSINDACALTLLKIIANIDDTNIITRSNYETLKEQQLKITKFLEKPVDFMDFAQELDEEFIKLNISAGGSADLLALTLFLYFFAKEV
ncbi:MAG: triphosphoribosyl-dephospho-CoA synthase CitG [Clostridia bacterium]